MNIYALVQNGIIINTVLASPADIKDPIYIWVDITSYSPRPGIGWATTDNINFTPPQGA